mgnify:CR=1 FL=1
MAVSFVKNDAFVALEIGQLMVLCVAVFVLCGTSPYENHVHTGLAAAYFAALCWTDPPIFASMRRRRPLMEQLQQRLHGIQLRSAQSPFHHQQQEILAACILQATVAVTIPMQILLLYDRGWQAQRWPVPVLLGSTVGWVGGTLFGTIVASMHKEKESIE